MKGTAVPPNPALTAYFMKRPVDIYAELQSTDKLVKGQALEAFAIYIMRLLGLRFVVWRKRGTETGGAELDVIMTGMIGPAPTVWQIHCKNTPSGQVRLEDVAKEVGLLPLTNATHIMLLANCPFSRDAVTFAREVMHNSPTTIFLLDRTAFDRIRADPAELAAVLVEQAEDITRARHDALASRLKAGGLS